MAKEAAATMVNAQQQYLLDNGTLAGSGIYEFTPYMNYVSVDTSTIIDSVNGVTSFSCVSPYICLKMHNGGMLLFHIASGVKYPASYSATNAVWAAFDPDGVYGGSTSGPSKSVIFYIYSNGRITTYDSLMPNTHVYYTGPIAPLANSTPEWFSWD